MNRMTEEWRAWKQQFAAACGCRPGGQGGEDIKVETKVRNPPRFSPPPPRPSIALLHDGDVDLLCNRKVRLSPFFCNVDVLTI